LECGLRAAPKSGLRPALQNPGLQAAPRKTAGESPHSGPPASSRSQSVPKGPNHCLPAFSGQKMVYRMAIFGDWHVTVCGPALGDPRSRSLVLPALYGVEVPAGLLSLAPAQAGWSSSQRIALLSCSPMTPTGGTTVPMNSFEVSTFSSGTMAVL
jgi:hypothetical protein